jgi:PAT family beta-lactamase induction signal transducer AmpG
MSTPNAQSAAHNDPALTGSSGLLQTYALAFANRRIGAMLLLGFASGLPLALSSGTLQAWLTVEGIDLKTIGFFALAGLPYTFKFVWAPLLDRFEPGARGWLGRRRGWLALTQIALAVLCWVLAGLDPKTQISAVGACAVLLAFCSASQDVAFDAYRADLLAPAERGSGAAVSVLGYRLAMLVSGGLALVLADQFLGWSNMYRAVGVLFGLLAMTSLLTPRVPDPQAHEPTQAAGTSEDLRAPARAPARIELRGFAAMVTTGLTLWVLVRWLPAQTFALGPLGRWPTLGWDTAALLIAAGGALWAARRVGFPSFVAPWDAFFSRPHALGLLAFIVLYKLGDAFAGSLSTAFLIRGIGFSATEVGAVNKALGLAATIVGVLAGGAWLARAPLWSALMVFGVLQAVSNLGYWVLSVSPKSLPLMATAIGVENLCGGLGTAAFVAFLMALTDARFSAAQFALLSALAAVGRVYVGPTAGVLVETTGWPTFFLISVLTALPALWVLLRLREPILALDAERLTKRPVLDS